MKISTTNSKYHFGDRDSVLIRFNFDPPQEVRVRFPTDREMCKRSADTRIIRHYYDGMLASTEYPNKDRVDADLFRNLIVKGGRAGLTDSDAAVAMKQLDEAVAVKFERDGDFFRIDLRVPGAETSHLVRLPGAEEIETYQIAAVEFSGDVRMKTVRIRLEPIGRFYDSIISASAGYAQGVAVPINHKFAVIAELAERMHWQ